MTLQDIRKNMRDKEGNVQEMTKQQAALFLGLSFKTYNELEKAESTSAFMTRSKQVFLRGAKLTLQEFDGNININVKRKAVTANA